MSVSNFFALVLSDLDEINDIDCDIIVRIGGDFEFSKKSFRTIAPAVIGIELKNIEDFSLLVERLKKHNFRFDYLNKKQDLFQFLI